MVDRGTIVRESKFRHLFGKPWKKELCFTDVKLQSSTNQSNSIRVSDEFFAVPWQTAGGSGSIVVVPISLQGPKIPHKYPVLNAHPTPITDFQFHPFHSMLVTCARESNIKLWSLPEHDGDQSIPGLPEELNVLELDARPTMLRFHPSVNNLLLSAASDKTVKLWDVEANRSVLTFSKDWNEAPLDAQWNLNGSLLACSFQKDKMVRVIDPRQNETIHEFVAHTGVKGTYLTFMESDRLLTVGFSKGAGGNTTRSLSVWDLQSGNTSSPVGSKPVAEHNFSSVMVPYYDIATGICYLTGRGNSIFYYEINNSAEAIYAIGQSNTSISYTGACPVPKRLNDVLSCELERFYVVSNDTVAISSIYCPRKSSQTVFQEDLYPAVPGPQPALSAVQWLEGETAGPTMISMKPAGVKSVFEVSKEEGGKSKAEEEKLLRSRTASKATFDANTLALLAKPEIQQGSVQVFTNGWFRKWGDRWLELDDDHLYCYDAKDSPNITLCLALESITKVDISNQNPYNITNARLFEVHSNSLSEPEYFFCQSAALCASWVKSIQLCVKKSQHTAPTEASSLFAEKALLTMANPETKAADPLIKQEESHGDAVKEGWLDMYTVGYIYNGWARRWFVLKGTTLSVYKSAHVTQANPQEFIHLAKVITLCQSEESPPGRTFTFKLCTATRVIHLAGANQEDMQHWMLVLGGIIHHDDPFLAARDSTLDSNQAEDADSQSSDQRTEGWVMKQNNGMMGLAKKWVKFYLTIAGGKDLLYTKSPSDTITRLRLSMQTIAEVTESEEFPETGFVLRTLDRQVYVHQVGSREERDQWIRAFQSSKKQFIDYFDQFQINEEDQKKRIKDKEIKYFIDPVDVKNGKSPQLIKVVGKRRVRVRVIPLSDALNGQRVTLSDCAVYVLDCGMTIYQWNGRSSPRVVKAKGWDLVNKIRTKERGGLATVVQMDQGKDNNAPDFWALLGGKPAPKKTTDEELKQFQQEQEQEDRVGDSIRIYRVLDDNVPKESRIKLIHEGSKPPPKEYLQSNAVSVVECGETEIYVWVGKDATNYQRKLGMIVALKLRETRPAGGPHNNYTLICRLVEKGETILFKEKFSNYPSMLPINVGKHEQKKSLIAASKDQPDIDVQKMHAAESPESFHEREQFYTDDQVTGKIYQQWKIDGFDKSAVPEEYFGQLWSSDSYVIVYKFPYQNKEKTLVYYWQGKFSTRNEKGTSAYLTVNISNDLNDVDQIRVVQDKENLHFLTVMNKYGYVVHMGKYGSEKRQIQPQLYIIQGDSAVSAHPTEIPLSGFNLNTLHCFVLKTNEQIFIWNGALSNEHERHCAVRFASHHGEAALPVVTGTEGDSDHSHSFDPFWKCLGGKLNYYGSNGAISLRKPIRLFTCTNATGVIAVNEVHNFSQEDTLHYEHILILDTFHDVFVWIGEKANAAERKLSMETAIEYVTSSPNGHSPDTPIWVVYPFTEPLAFTAAFPTWSRALYPSKKQNLPPAQVPVMSVLQDYLPKTYLYEELLQDPLPVGVDPSRLEQFLADDEFQRVFKVSREEFVNMPGWKAEKLKQDAGLF